MNEGTLHGPKIVRLDIPSAVMGDVKPAEVVSGRSSGNKVVDIEVICHD